MSRTARPSTTHDVARPDGTMDLHVWMPDVDPEASSDTAPDAAPVPGLVLCHEIFGVGDYIADVAGALVDEGYAVAAPELFWRFAPGWAANHDAEGLAASMDQVGQLDVPAAVADVGASIAALDALPTVGEVGVIGFCLGGTLAFAAAIEHEPVVCVSYYGSGVVDLVGRIDEVACPTLFHFGNSDEYMPDGTVDAVAAAIGGSDRHVLNVENAGHAFDNHRAAMFHVESAAQAAWSKTVAFLRTHLPPT